MSNQVFTTENTENTEMDEEERKKKLKERNNKRLEPGQNKNAEDKQNSITSGTHVPEVADAGEKPAPQKEIDDGE